MEKHVLIASKDPAVSEGLGGILMRCGFETDAVASDGIDAIALAEKYGPQVCFIDESIGTLDAFSVAGAIKAGNPECVCFILCDGYESRAQEGVDGFIVKPVTEKFLAPWLRTKLARHEDISSIKDTRDALMAELGEKRTLEEAAGKIAGTSGISLGEARKVLCEKAKALGISDLELARKIAGKN